MYRIEVMYFIEVMLCIEVMYFIEVQNNNITIDYQDPERSLKNWSSNQCGHFDISLSYLGEI